MIADEINMFGDLIYFTAFIFGASVGSFLNVCILRIPENKPIGLDRSRCPKCGTILKASDLTPLLSYVLLLGKCRYCKTEISPRYFLIELLTAIMFVAAVKFFDITTHPADSIIFAAFSCVMIIVTFIDIDHFIIPDRFSIGLIIAGPIFSLFNFYPLNHPELYHIFIGEWYKPLLNSLSGIAVAGGIFLFIFIAAEFYYSRKGIEAFGFGDVKLAAGIGAFLGWKIALFMVFFSFVIGILFALPAMIIQKKGTKDQIPFAPAICVSGILSFLLGSEFISWYVNLNSMFF